MRPARSRRAGVVLAVAGVVASLALEVVLARGVQAAWPRGIGLTFVLIAQCAAIASLGPRPDRRRALWLLLGTAFILPYVLIVFLDSAWRFR